LKICDRRARARTGVARRASFKKRRTANARPVREPAYERRPVLVRIDIKPTRATRPSRARARVPASRDRPFFRRATDRFFFSIHARFKNARMNAMCTRVFVRTLE
jgi:hypothetical protein